MPLLYQVSSYSLRMLWLWSFFWGEQASADDVPAHLYFEDPGHT
ncbi:hypothetical protein SH580_18760 [Coraliomargarita algicola]|uniref:Uncharacterized protein n=1 Tax=Coraliomargarita algicola TaxID=3092156 RepID=A0ABZ0RRA3_9BACT|nr:hypothetical protein [Coraliomargarita sp. J2-16]WPJ95464.1 hypothetical protein SH580_18760 [Coraliomargarita sp. J2-16]